ncbi:MAG: hypothetical protein RR405_02525 [Clostridia bacterium]
MTTLFTHQAIIAISITLALYALAILIYLPVYATTNNANLKKDANAILAIFTFLFLVTLFGILLWQATFTLSQSVATSATNNMTKDSLATLSNFPPFLRG